MSRFSSPPSRAAVSTQVQKSRVIAIALGALVTLAASPAFAQSAMPSWQRSVDFSAVLAADPVQVQAQPQTEPPAQPAPKTKHEGFGIGIKGGPMFAKLDTSGGTVFQQKAGYQIGLFLGGNRPGVFGVGTEITYIRRNAQAQGSTTVSSNEEALEIPLLFRLNAGASHLSGPDVYFLFGPAIDINVKKFDSSFVANTTSYDLNGIVGVGVEVERIILEFRYNRSFRNVARTLDTGTAVNMHSFVLLVGLRFN